MDPQAEYPIVYSALRAAVDTATVTHPTLPFWTLQYTLPRGLRPTSKELFTKGAIGVAGSFYGCFLAYEVAGHVFDRMNGQIGIQSTEWSRASFQAICSGAATVWGESRHTRDVSLSELEKRFSNLSLREPLIGTALKLRVTGITATMGRDLVSMVCSRVLGRKSTHAFEELGFSRNVALFSGSLTAGCVGACLSNALQIRRIDLQEYATFVAFGLPKPFRETMRSRPIQLKPFMLHLCRNPSEMCSGLLPRIGGIAMMSLIFQVNDRWVPKAFSYGVVQLKP